jgi:predicted MFS family arabinose efflux permease
VGFFAWLFRVVWGDDVDRALRPVLAVQLAGSLAFSSAWTFLGIWAVRELGASSRQLSFAFLFGAIAAVLAGYLGGHFSDHVGRRPLILFGWGAEAIFILLYALVGQRVYLGLVLVALGAVLGSIGGAADQAMVADVVPPERHEAAYAAVRVANNLGVTLGPPIGGLLLLGDNWTMLFVGVSVMAACAFAIAWRFLPKRGAYAPDEPPTRGSFGVIVRDRPFLLFLLSGALAYLVYIAYETVLPISAVQTHGLAPSTWGFLVIINPAMVTFGQLRLTRALRGVPAGPKLVVAMLLMGFPFLLLSVNGSVATFAFVILVFVIGEMLWVPTSQTVVAGLAPEDVRGAYMGAFGSTASFAFALGPFVGLQLRGAYGDGAMWAFFAAVSVFAALTGAAAVRFTLGRRRAAAATAAGGV